MKDTLRTTDELFRAAADASLDSLFVAKGVRDDAGHLVDFECIDVNGTALKLLGLTREKVLGQKLWGLLPINRDSFFDKYAQVLSTGSPLEEEFSIDTPENKAKWLRHQVVRAGDGIAVFARDVTLRKEAESKLKESEERLRLAMTAAHLGVWTWDLNSDRFVLLEGVETIFGLPPGQGSHPPEELIEAAHPEDRDLLARALSDGRKNGTPIQLEFRTAQSDGTVRWVEGQGTFVRGATGAPERGVGIVMDITERKQAEESRLQNHLELSEAQRVAHVGNWKLDVATGHLTWSDELYRMFGWNPELPPPDYAALAPFYTPESWERLTSAVSHTQETGAPYELELEAVRVDGLHGWMLARGEAIRDESGAIVKLRGIAMDVSGRKAGELALSRANRALRTLSACNAALIGAASEPELLDTICRLIVDAGGYSMAWVGFAEQSPDKRVRVVAQYGSTQEYMQSMNLSWADTEQGRGPTGMAIRTGTTQVHQSLMDDSDKALWRDAALAQGFQSSIALPLKELSGSTGALTLYARERDAFTEEEVHLLEELADDLAFGIQTLRTRVDRDRMAQAQLHHVEVLRKSLEESIQAISDTVEMRDPYTAGHQKRVALLAVAIASELGLPKEESHGIHLAASIHDLGKIQVPAEILSKPGKITDVEYMLIKAHSQTGYDILKGIAFPWPIAKMVLQHHERLDGSGYPQGLKGEQIVQGARIIAVADVVEAMSSHRPYRPGLGIDKALAEIEKGRSTFFDPAVVDACLKLFREGRFAF
jgi:PAS domain S-box-containing protein